MTEYWRVVLKRMVDNMALQLMTVQNVVNREMEMEIITEVISPQGGGD